MKKQMEHRTGYDLEQTMYDGQHIEVLWNAKIAALASPSSGWSRGSIADISTYPRWLIEGVRAQYADPGNYL